MEKCLPNSFPAVSPPAPRRGTGAEEAEWRCVFWRRLNEVREKGRRCGEKRGGSIKLVREALAEGK